jgi:hypothetical protein
MSPRALLFAELSVAVRTAQFWGIVLRNAIPLAGVVLLGWPAALLVAFYLIEIWWFLSLRMAVEIAVEDELKRDAPLVAGRLTGLTLRNFLIGAPVLGVLFFAVAGMFVVLFLVEWDWRQFLASPAAKTFFVSLGLLGLFLLVESVRYGLRYYGAGGKTDRDGELRMMAIFCRIPCLVIAGPFLFFLMPFRHAMEIVAVFLTLASIWIEGAPRHATKLIGVPTKTRRALFRRD